MVKAIPLWFIAFQSPWAGQICLNASKGFEHIFVKIPSFQSPLSGQICLNNTLLEVCDVLEIEVVSIPFIGSNLFKCGYYNIAIKGEKFQSPLSGQICLNKMRQQM